MTINDLDNRIIEEGAKQANVPIPPRKYYNGEPIPREIPILIEELKYIDSHVYEILDLRETAVLLRMSRRTVTRLTVLGQIPGTKVGREWRFLRKEILELVKKLEW